MVLDIIQYPYGKWPWSEYHELSLDKSGGKTELWAITLPIVDYWKEYQDSVNTLFGGTDSCSNRKPSLTWMLTAYGQDQAVGDCIVWGAETKWFAKEGCRVVK